MAKLTFRIWLLIILLIVAMIVIINPKSFIGGVEIKSIVPNSSAYNAGLVSGEVIQKINEQKINNLDDYSKAISSLIFEDIDIEIKTKNDVFKYKAPILEFELTDKKITSVYGKAKEIGLKEGMLIEEINGFSLDDYSLNEIRSKIEPKTKITIKTDKNEYVFLTSKNLGIIVAAIEPTRIRMGLDLQGGARALVKPERALSQNEMANLLETIRYRLNVYGLTDVNVREVNDLQGNSYVMVELAGATPSELQDLIGKQGKFEAKIVNETVFVGGHNDITFVCRNDASCARIEQCTTIQDGQAICRFQFEVHLSESAAAKHAAVTANLSENLSEGKSYLNETLDLYLDDKLVDRLMISSELKGKITTSVAVSGSGIGKTKLEAYENAEANMKKLQTILITGSLPFKLEIIKLDSISPTLGKEFTKNVILAAIAVFIAVCLVIYIRYKKLKLFIPIVITMVSEALLTLFIAVIIRWNLDLASIAGIIAAIGTGVDDQIIMIDESESKASKQFSMKERIKRAFFIIMGAYATVVVSLLPLLWAGAGLLRGFAVTTLIGITVGVFITRPAFADILKLITKE
ncbi:MAG: site-2 protease family protein [Candidatus Pacearchaeota archaeon]